MGPIGLDRLATFDTGNDPIITSHCCTTWQYYILLRAFSLADNRDDELLSCVRMQHLTVLRHSITKVAQTGRPRHFITRLSHASYRKIVSDNFTKIFVTITVNQRRTTFNTAYKN